MFYICVTPALFTPVRKREEKESLKKREGERVAENTKYEESESQRERG